MTGRTSHLTGLWIGAAISNTSHSNQAGSTAVKSSTANRKRIKVDGSVAIINTKNFPIGLHVMYLYFPETTRMYVCMYGREGVHIYIYIYIIRGGTQRFLELFKKIYLKYLYKFETLVHFELLPLRLDAAIPTPLPMLETLFKSFNRNAVKGRQRITGGP